MCRNERPPQQRVPHVGHMRPNDGPRSSEGRSDGIYCREAPARGLRESREATSLCSR